MAPEIIDKRLERAVDKIVSEAERLESLVSEVRRALENRRDLFVFGQADRPRSLCYAAIDSSYTAPAIELLGGYLAITNVSRVVYGSGCGRTSAESRAYVDFWLTRDETRTAARVYERLNALELLRAKRRGLADFDVLLIDGEVIPRVLSAESPLTRRLIEATDRLIDYADRTDTALVGVLKRSYARDIAAILGLPVSGLSDRALMSHVLEVGEYVVTASYADLYEELARLRDRASGEVLRWLEARLRWFDMIVSSIPVGYTVKQAFYRAYGTVYPAATKIEYMLSGHIDDQTLLSSLIHVSSGTGVPAPVDYADRLSSIPRGLRQTVYQMLLAEATKRSGGRASVARLLSLMNPEKIESLLG